MRHFAAGDGGVAEVAEATDDAVSADNGLLGLDDDGLFIPHEGLFEDFEDLLVDDRGLDTADAPLVLGDEQGRHGVLHTHQEVVNSSRVLKSKVR